MKMTGILIGTTALCICLVALSCSDPSAEEPSANSLLPETPEVDVWLTISYTIGVEMGDSNLVFGKPAVPLILENGNIAVLDIAKYRVSIFDHEGEFLDSFGRQGSGPGEFRMPANLSATPSGGFVVSDAMARRLLFFDSSMNYTGYMGNFFPAPPLKAVFLTDSLLIGEITAYETTDDEMLAGFEIAKWKIGSFDEQVVYFSDLKPFSLQSIGSSEASQPVFTASREGMVYTSALSTTEFTVDYWNNDGSLLLTIEESFTPVPRSQEEIDREREFTHDLFRRNGMPEEMIESIQPEKYEYAVNSLGIGPDGNLWVRTGIYDQPVFRIYSASTGEFMNTAALNSTEDCSDMDIFVSPNGFTALESMSDEWPRVYLLELQ